MISFLIFWFSFFLSYLVGVDTECSRSLSRVVRNEFMQKIEPAFAELSLPLPSNCPFSVNRDVYGTHERYKKLESVTKWVCLFCGKTFFDEPYLDKHLEWKHFEYTPQGSEVRCLADYCDIFRCDIVTGRTVGEYWDKALCRETEMMKLVDKCQHILGSCIPKQLDLAQQNRIFDVMNETVCSYLTCSKFWDVLDDEISPAYTALYITAAVFILFGLLIYYFVAYSHFYTDESLLDGPNHRHSRSRINDRHSTYSDGNLRYRR